MRLRWIVLVAVVVLAASSLAGVAQPQAGRSADATGRTITVSGHGTVTTVPDRASFDFTAETRAPTATAALSRNADAATAVVAALRAAGVAGADLQTSQVSLSPQTTQDGTQVVGYVASTTITAETSIPKAGSVVDAAVGAGATAVSGPSLSRSDEDALYRDALREAVADAKQKAAALATAGGLTLGPVQSITEGGSAPVPLPFAQATAGSAPTIEPGTQTVGADVTVTFSAAA